MRLGVDLISGDSGIKVTLPACHQFLLKNPDVSLVVYTTTDHPVQPSDRIDVVTCPQAVAMSDSVRSALRMKADTTMGCALNDVANERIHGLLSLGNTGAYMALAMKYVGLSSEYSRTAICSAVPPHSDSFPVFMVDVGANLTCTADDLLGFAKMAQQEMLFKEQTCKVGLLNIGHEDTKGGALIKETHQLLKADPTFDYVGYVEPKDIVAGKVNIVVTDGFTGNIYIKSGSANIKHSFKTIFDQVKEHWFGLAGLSLSGRIIKQRFSTFSSPFTCAKFLGLNGTVAKCHGSSTSQDVTCGLHLVKQWCEVKFHETVQ